MMPREGRGVEARDLEALFPHFPAVVQLYL